MAIECPKCHHKNPPDTVYCGQCGTPLPAPKKAAHTKTAETPTEDLTRGTTFAGRYEIIEELGKGGMGKVYRVFDNKLNEEVALKLIKPEISQDKKTLERFSHELKTARKISHTNVGRMYELMEDRGLHFITMEYVSGQDLKGLIRQSAPLSISRTIKIAKQVCEGLAEAHRAGVVHRDLKPSNIMIDREGDIKIMDFGIARSLKEKGITGAGVMIGTPEYMSPEQVEAQEIDQRSDIYSLGILLYEMTTGKLPFEADTPFAVGIKQKSEIPKDPKDFNPQVPDDLNQVILKCLEKDKDSRYQSAGEVRSELDNIEKGVPATESETPTKKPLTSKEITVSFRMKKLLVPGFLAAVLVTAAVILIWSPWANKDLTSFKADKASVAVLPFEDLSPQKDQGYLCDGLAESLINALSKINELRVPARTSSFSFKGQDLIITDIGEKLHVENILVGSLQMAENRIRITTQLISAADESLLWSEQYNRELDDVFAIQDEITLKIIEILRVKLIGGERTELVKRDTNDVEAYQLYLKGKHFRWIEQKEGLFIAKDYFEQSIEQDPDYASAYAGLAEVYMMLGLLSILPREESALQAKNAARTALELDENSSAAHTSMGVILEIYDWDWEAAEQEFLRAIDLNPNYYNAHYEYGALLTRMMRLDAAEEEFLKAQQIDPLSPHTYRWLGMVYRLRGDLEKAEKQLKKKDELAPPSAADEDAIVRAEKMIERDGRLPQHLRRLAFAHIESGDELKAREVIEELKALYDESDIGNIAYNLARIYSVLGETDAALTWLEHSYEKRDPHLVAINYASTDALHLEFKFLSEEPRFKMIQKKMGLD